MEWLSTSPAARGGHMEKDPDTATARCAVIIAVCVIHPHGTNPCN